MKRFVLVLAVAAIAAVPALAQQMAGERGEASLALDKGKVSVEYGRPSLKGRDLTQMMKPGVEWRLGSNSPTTLTTSVPLTFGATKVPAGTYVLRAKLNDDKTWTLVFLKQGDNARVGETPLTLGTAGDSAEMLTMGLERAGTGGKLNVHWGTLMLTTPFEAGS